MKKIYLILSLLLCSLVGQAQGMKEKIDSLITHHPLMQQASLGIMIYDLTADSVLYAQDEKKLHRPASTTKTFTCATALKNLGNDYQIETAVYATGEIRKRKIHGKKRNVLEGDIWVKGNFDPAFSSADMDTLLMAIKEQDIEYIEGNLYADRSMKNRTLSGYGWCWDDSGDDSPLLSPLVVDKDTCFMSGFTAGLEQQQIGIKENQVQDSLVPANAYLLAKKSRTLGELLPHCLKTSDNRYAESILYQLGNLNNTPYDSTEDCIEYINQLLEELGFTPKKEFRFVDGSGLSFYNMVTPEVEVGLMKYIYHTSFFKQFKNALPISGIDGTLKNRMRGTKAEGKVFAKTGSLTGTYTLTGYVMREDRHILAFSMMHDGVPVGMSATARGMQDEILISICSEKQ